MAQGEAGQPETGRDGSEHRHRLQLPITQILAGVLAAITAAFGASYLGVNGTIIGAAVMSLFSAVGTAVYTHSLKRTGERMRAAVPSRLARVGTGAVVVFVAALAVLTGVELIAGRPVSDLVRGKAGSGTTAFGNSQPGRTTPTTPAPTVTVTRTVVPKIVVSTPTITHIAPAVTVTPTVTATPSAPTTATGAPTATPTPSAPISP